MQWSMQRCSILQPERVATEMNADIIIAEETGIENSEVRETENTSFGPPPTKWIKKTKKLKMKANAAQWIKQVKKSN